MFDKFNQLKDLAKMRQKAMELQKELEKIIKTVEKNGWQVSVTGDQKIRYIKKDGEDMKELVDLINNAMKDVQKDSAKKMMEMGGGLGGLLGGMK
ncbi:MAG TPA: YbaB/EbfC family nucleoid-associated protein [Alphaproteobacteria bacterium]|jgi:DNA-binding protein YbaB|nr:YbaB/EbfC family nucleoid-associated protein [Alphaproteobacteria bacterium]